MEIVFRRRAAVLGVLCLFTLLAAGPAAALPVLRGYANEKAPLAADQVAKLVEVQRASEGKIGECGPGVCVGDSFCDDCACYSPEAPISQVACRCKLIDPSCGIGECVGNGAYCEGPFCPAPVCYAPESPISQVLCQGAQLDERCQVKKPGCGPGYCVGDSFCDSCACYAPEAPISQVACRCRLMDPSCGLGECVGNGAYCEGPFCPAPVCYAPSSPISQVLCQGAVLGRDCTLGPSCTPPPWGMKAWWPFDETAGTTAQDIVGGNHGTHQNGPVPTAGKVAYGLSFDGVNDYVNAPAVTTHDYVNLTVDAWIYPRSTNADGRTILDWGGLTYRLILEGDELRFVTQPNPLSYAPLSTNANIPLGTWTHVAVVADNAAHQIRFYVNGNLVSTFTQYTANYSYMLPGWAWTIGGVPGEDYFDGIIDEVEIFERVLAQSEIQAIVNAGPGGKCKISG
ncbi:MAG: LamG domain-containing protein [Thermoanaerobaculia bacterium]